jgi:hypothetical protein
MKVSKQQLTMNGKTFKECWFREDLIINDNDDLIVNFIDNRMSEIFLNGKKIWSND